MLSFIKAGGPLNTTLPQPVLKNEGCPTRVAPVVAHSAGKYRRSHGGVGSQRWITKLTVVLPRDIMLQCTEMTTGVTSTHGRL